MSESVIEEKVGDYTVAVVYDSLGFDSDIFPCQPDTWGIDLSNHRDYKSPTYGAESPIDVRCFFLPVEDLEDYEVEMLEQCRKDYTVMPVYMYEHGGRTVSTSEFADLWDSGCAGITYIKNDDAVAHAVIPEDFLKQGVQQLDYHMTGQVYGYIVTDKSGGEVDSCWGFVGESDYCMEEGKSAAQYRVDEDGRRDAELVEYIMNT